MRGWFGIRIVPLTMFMALMLLGVKVGDLISGGQHLSEALLASRVVAETKGQEPSSQMPKAAEHGEKKPEEKEAKKEEKPAEAGTHDAKEEKKNAHGEEKSDKEAKPAAAAAPPPMERRFNAVELDILQNLAKRREELEQWERNIQVKDQLLAITDKQLAEKLAQMEAMKQELSQLLAQYNEQENAKLRSLVKIYESMKPKEAARIFEEVDMPILLLVVDRMSEKKAAPILASMDPVKAKQVTVELAEQRKMQGGRLNSGAKAQ